MLNLQEITDYLNEVEKSKEIDTNQLNTFIQQISNLIKENTEYGKVYGIYKGQLLKIRKELAHKDRVITKKQIRYDEADKISQWIAIQNGHLKIGHKPGGKKTEF